MLQINTEGVGGQEIYVWPYEQIVYVLENDTHKLS